MTIQNINKTSFSMMLSQGKKTRGNMAEGRAEVKSVTSLQSLETGLTK